MPLNILIKLFLAFTLIPVTEIYLLITIGGYIGAMNTVLLVIMTGFAGAYLARLQGMQTMFRVRESLQRGIMPSGELLDALLIFIAGVVLLTPGFITDIAGILLLLPPVRTHLKQMAINKLNQWIKDQHIEFRQYP
jgi:UPF0716 protein FxsA